MNIQDPFVHELLFVQVWRWHADQIAQAIAALLALLSGLAWLKSALVHAWPNRRLSKLDKLVSKTMDLSGGWNAIAALLAALAAGAQFVTYLLTYP